MRFRKIRQGGWWQFQQRILQSVLNSGRDTGRTLWGPYGDYFEGAWGIITLWIMYPLSSSINVSIFHITWLDTFWTDLLFHLQSCSCLLLQAKHILSMFSMPNLVLSAWDTEINKTQLLSIHSLNPTFKLALENLIKNNNNRTAG